MQVGTKISATQKLRRKLEIPINKILNPVLLEDLYIKQNKSLEDIARNYSCSRVHIYNLCKKYNIQVRNKGEARKLAQLGGKLPERPYHKINEKFFSEWNNDMAYVLGFIYADGYLHHGFNFLMISQKEKGILEKIQDLMQSNHGLKHYKHQDIYHLIIGNKKIINDLISLGLTRAKSLIIKFPNMPEQFISHFIRGYFDGDGSISRSSSWRVSIVTGSQNFIESIKENLEKLASVSQQKINKHKHATAYYIAYHSRGDITKLFNFFYDEYTLKKELYLTRKYLKFTKAIESYNSRDKRGYANEQIREQN